MKSLICMVVLALMFLSYEKESEAGSSDNLQVVANEDSTPEATESYGSCGRYGYGIARREARRAGRVARRVARRASYGSHGTVALSGGQGASVAIIAGVGWNDVATAQACLNCVTVEAESETVPAPK